jgi:hypothetical protein
MRQLNRPIHTKTEKIWRLSLEYSGGGDLIQNLIYATTFSNFIVSEWVTEVVWRDDGRKVVHHATVGSARRNTIHTVILHFFATLLIMSV